MKELRFAGLVACLQDRRLHRGNTSIPTLCHVTGPRPFVCLLFLAAPGRFASPPPAASEKLRTPLPCCMGELSQRTRRTSCWQPNSRKRGLAVLGLWQSHHRTCSAPSKPLFPKPTMRFGSARTRCEIDVPRAVNLGFIRDAAVVRERSMTWAFISPKPRTDPSGLRKKRSSAAQA